MSRYFIAKCVMELKPGDAVTVSSELLRKVVPLPGWRAEDSIMELIVGSAYEFTYFVSEWNGNAVFKRLEKPLTNGLRTYVSPDRRHYYKQRTDGLWEFDPSAAPTLETTEEFIRRHGPLFQ